MTNLVGKVFRRGGGQYPGYWVVIGLTPRGGCICLGVDSENNIVGAANYQPYYVERKEAVGKIDISAIRIESVTSDPSLGHGRAETSGLPPILWTKSSHDGPSTPLG